LRSWVVNVEVPADYARRDPEQHLEDIARAAGLSGRGAGMLTAASIDDMREATDTGVAVHATVGIDHPTWAAVDDGLAGDGAFAGDPAPGTINVVAFVPARLSDAAMVNAVVTLTEAKTQALLDAGISATGTASDAVCILALDAGEKESFCGPRSLWGARLARATYRAVSAGCVVGTEAGSAVGDEPE